MPYEVFYIAGATRRRKHDEPSFGISETRDAILEVYKHAAKEGGRVVAGHTLTVDEARRGNAMPEPVEVLFLVAEFPEKQTQVEQPPQ